jgi:hypothetical protein
MIISNCGFDDSQIARILSLLMKFKDPIQISITKEEMGNNTIEQIVKIIPKGLKKLNIC